MPLVRELAGGNRNNYLGSLATELARIEGISTHDRLGMNPPQVRIDGAMRVCAIDKTLELGMVAIAARIVMQHRPGQERFAPQRDQPLRIEVFRMQ